MTWPQLPAGLLAAEGPDTLLLLDTASGRLHTPDQLSALVLRHRELFRDRADAAQELAEVFEIDQESAHDRLRHLEELLAGAAGTRREEAFLKRRPRPPRQLPIPDKVHADFRIDALGFGIRVVCHDDDLAAAVAPLIEAFETHHATAAQVDLWRDGAAIRIALNGGLMSTEFDVATSMFRLASLLTAMGADESPSPILVHAAGVVVDGRAWLLAGSSNQGKSSTTVELMRRGAAYLTDEIVALEPAGGLVSGLARPIGLEGRYREARPELAPDPEGSPSQDRRWTVPPSKLGPVSHLAPLGGICFLNYNTSGPAAPPQPLSTTEALSTLLPLMYRRSRLTPQLIDSLVARLGETPAWQIVHTGADHAADTVLSIAREQGHEQPR